METPLEKEWLIVLVLAVIREAACQKYGKPLRFSDEYFRAKR
jgi:hypothetical protein